MKIKILSLNTEIEFLRPTKMIDISTATINDLPTLHDYDVIIFDNYDLIDRTYTTSLDQTEQKRAYDNHNKINGLISQAVKSGVWLFVFSSPDVKKQLYPKITTSWYSAWGWTPFDVNVISKSGDTIRILQENRGIYKPLFDEFSIDDIEWLCYFEDFPEDSTIIATNRAGHPTFLEIPHGKGMIVLLPLFNDRNKAIEIIVNRIVPTIIHIDEDFDMPKWVRRYSHPLEIEAEKTISEFRKVKQILYTNHRGTEKSSAIVLETLGFCVEQLPAGTLPDLRIEADGKIGIIEVKGHENRLTNRREVLQVLGYLSEEDISEKAIVISNHDFSKSPHERERMAFTQGAIDLANKTEIALISSIDLWNVYIAVKEGKLSEKSKLEIRSRILTTNGIVDINDILQDT